MDLICIYHLLIEDINIVSDSKFINGNIIKHKLDKKHVKTLPIFLTNTYRVPLNKN